MLSWIRSFLTNREYFVHWNDTNSKHFEVTCGVAQGSILGPLFFILYINDIINVSNILQMILYADDMTSLLCNKDINNLFSAMNSQLQLLSDWFACNKMLCNVDKNRMYAVSVWLSQCLCFSSFY